MSKTKQIGRYNNKKLSLIPQQPQDPAKNLNPKQKINFFLNNIQQKIVQQIDQHKQSISSYQSPFFENEDEKVIKKKKQNLKKLVQQKKKAQMKLKQLADKQYELQHEYRLKLKQQYFDNNGIQIKNEKDGNNIKSMRNNKSQNIKHKQFQNQFISNQTISSSNESRLANTRSLHKLRPKSQLTIQDVKVLKQLKKEYKKFEQQAQMKTKKHNQDLQNIRKQNIQLQQLMRRQRNDKKKKQIQIKLKDLQKVKQQRTKKYQQEQIRLYEVKKKPKQHQKLMKQFEEKQKQFQQHKIQQMKLRLKNKMLDLSQINQHQKQYQQLKQQQSKLIQDKYLQQSKFLKQSKLYQPQYKSKYYKSVIQEEKQRKLSIKKKQLATIQKCQRIKSYAEKVYYQYAPRLKTKQNQQQEEQQSKSDTHHDRSLSLEQRKKIGDNYLKQVIQHLKLKQKPKSSINSNTTKSTNLPPITSLSTKYKDYLIQQRGRQGSIKQRQELIQKRARVRYNNSIQKVKRIMNQQYNQRNKYESIDKIKQIAQKLQHDPNSKNYIDKIKVKLQILQTIT